jgi:hypothetical protein
MENKQVFNEKTDVDIKLLAAYLQPIYTEIFNLNQIKHANTNTLRLEIQQISEMELGDKEGFKVLRDFDRFCFIRFPSEQAKLAYLLKKL